MSSVVLCPISACRGIGNFTGVTITDALEAGAVQPFGTIGQRATLAAQAGMDLILCWAQQATEGDQAKTRAGERLPGRNLGPGRVPGRAAAGPGHEIQPRQMTLIPRAAGAFRLARAGYRLRREKATPLIQMPTAAPSLSWSRSPRPELSGRAFGMSSPPDTEV